METEEREVTNEAQEGDKDSYDTKLYIGCLVVQERIPLRKAIGKSISGGCSGTGSEGGDSDDTGPDGSGGTRRV